MKKSVWIKIFSFLMVFCFAFLFTGCAGGMASDTYQDLLDKLENGEISEEDFLDQMKETRIAPLYATKVLYRPEHYDFSQGGGEFSDYFAKYALKFYRGLIYEYGVSDSNNNPSIENLYMYDSIRYSVNEINNVTSVIIVNNNVPDKPFDENGVAIVADTWSNWNASYNYNSSNIKPLSYITSDNNYERTINNDISKYLDAPIDLKQSLVEYYDDNKQQYWKNLLFKNPTVEDEVPTTDEAIAQLITDGKQSDIVKAIEYILYCFELDLQPREITFVQGTAAERPVEVRVTNFRDIDEALEYVKEVFQKRGSSVGLSKKSRTKLKNWILETLIGEDAINNQDVVVRENVTRVEYLDASGTLVNVEYRPSSNPDDTKHFSRDYETTVEDTITTMCDEVQIGNLDGDDVHVNDKFLASEVKDYWGTTFSIAGEGDQFEGIPAMEYQSAVLMFEEDFELSNLWIAFKYDAGQDGDKIVDPKASITIKVKLNLYKKDSGWQEVAVDTIKVPDGEFDYLGATVPDGYTHMARFEGLGPANSEEGIKVGAFNPEIGDSILKAMEYNGKKMISDPIKLVGSTKVKDYYKLIEPEEPLPDGTTYTYGILNHEKFGGEDGCDYLEIAFEVVKIAGDVDTNYKFQAGIAMIG